MTSPTPAIKYAFKLCKKLKLVQLDYLPLHFTGHTSVVFPYSLHLVHFYRICLKFQILAVSFLLLISSKIYHTISRLFNVPTICEGPALLIQCKRKSYPIEISKSITNTKSLTIPHLKIKIDPFFRFHPFKKIHTKKYKNTCQNITPNPHLAPPPNLFTPSSIRIPINFHPAAAFYSTTSLVAGSLATTYA